MASADYFAVGEWNFYCDLCGRKAKSSAAVKTWDGFYVCRSHKEVRNPQDFVKGVRDDQTVPWSRSNSGVPAVVAANLLLDTAGNAITDTSGNMITTI